MDIRRLYPLVLLLAVSNPHGGCDRGDEQDGSKDDTQEGSDRNGGCGGGCGNGCSSSTDDSVSDDTDTGDSIDTAPPVDADGDGYTTDEDCDDGNVAVYPGADELCDRLNNDCDTTTDEGLTACFYGLDGSTKSLEDEFTAGLETDPAEVFLSTPGRLVLGSGKWFVSLRITAPVEIDGEGIDQTQISGGSMRSVVVVEDSMSTFVSASISGLSIINGLGSEFHKVDADITAGGAVFCRSTASTPANIVMKNVAISNAIADFGGAIYSSGCELEFSDSQFEGVSTGSALNNYGGALLLLNSTATLTNVEVTGFNASLFGGAVFVDESSSLSLINSVIADNLATSGANIFSRGSVTCEGTTAAAGVWGGVATESGGGIFLDINHSPTLTSTGCDWGSGDDDNSPDDVGISDSFSVTTLTTESFTCDVDGCTLTE